MNIIIKNCEENSPKLILKDKRDDKLYKTIDLIKLGVNNIINQKLQIVEIDPITHNIIPNGIKLLIGQKSLDENFEGLGYYD